MIQYGSDRVTDLIFHTFNPIMERRDQQWVDIVLEADVDEQTPVPDDFISFTVFVICMIDGTIVQMIPRDEDCDCEFQFTVGEKEQIRRYIEQPYVQAMIQSLPSPV